MHGITCSVSKWGYIYFYDKEAVRLLNVSCVTRVTNSRKTPKDMTALNYLHPLFKFNAVNLPGRYQMRYSYLSKR